MPNKDRQEMENFLEGSVNDELKDAIELNITNCSTSILWNNQGGKFTQEKLSYEAQFSPVYASLLNDFNDDGKIDIIIGGNQFRAKPQTGIYTSSYGAIFENIDKDRFKVMKSEESGIFIKGEIRDIKQIKVGDKKHILVSTNNDKLKCYNVINEK